MDGDVEVNSLLNLNWLYIDKEDVLWEMKKRNLNYKARIIKGEGHYWSYVEKELPYVLKFHSDNFMEAKNE